MALPPKEQEPKQQEQDIVRPSSFPERVRQQQQPPMHKDDCPHCR